MHKIRFSFSKKRPCAYVSHLDLIKLFQRAFRRSAIPVRYSEGFNPHILMSIPAPLSTGYETDCDVCDLETLSDVKPETFADQINKNLPRGLMVIEAWAPIQPAGAVCTSIYEMKYDGVSAAAAQELFSQPVMLEKKSKRGSKIVDITEYISAIMFTDHNNAALCTAHLSAGSESLNPKYITAALVNAGALPEDSVVLYNRKNILDKDGNTFR